MKFMENTKINFMKFKSFGFGLSSVLAFGSIILLLLGVNLGIDFKGGTAIGVSFSEDVSIQEVRGSLKSVSLNDSVVDLSGEEIKYFGSQSDVMIKIKSLDNEPENFGQIVINHLYDSMSAKAPENKNDFILSLGSVSPKVGSELSGKAFWSVVSALVLILFYISVRFEFRFALGAILALVHDVIITLGIFSLTGFEITLSTVAAFLTIVGYSLNDTIVINGNALDEEVMIEANLDESETVLALTNDDETNIMSAFLAKKLGAKKTLIILNNYSYINILPKSFVDLPLSPQRMTVSLVMQHLTSVDMPQEVLLKMNSGVEALEGVIHFNNDTKDLFGSKYVLLPLPENSVLGSIYRNGKNIIPSDDLTIERDDHLIVFINGKTDKSQIEKLFKES